MMRSRAQTIAIILSNYKKKNAKKGLVTFGAATEGPRQPGDAIARRKAEGKLKKAHKHEWGFDSSFAVAKPGEKLRKVTQLRCRICGATKRNFLYRGT